MNDFTKEELRILGACVFSKRIECMCDPTLKNKEPFLKDLQTKLESMADNYCEHDWKLAAHRPDECSKCGVLNP